MEVIKGKGLTAISTIFIAIAWFDEPISEYSFQGFPFQNIPEWKLITPLVIAWVIFSFRYWQGKEEMLDAVKLDFLKHLKKVSAKRIYNGGTNKIHRVEMEVNVKYMILDRWSYAIYKSDQSGNTTLHYYAFEEVDSKYKTKWKTFKWKNRSYLNYFLPVWFATGGLVSLAIIVIRMCSY